MQTSQDLDKFAPAFVAFQAEVENAHKTSSNPHFKSKYADLAEVLNTVGPALAKHGLALLQGVGEVIDGKLHVTTRLLHASGQWVQTTTSCPLAKSDPQGLGSATTYTRRYAAAGICGIAQEDDDAESATVRDSPKAEKGSKKGDKAADEVMPPEEARAELELLLILQAIQGTPEERKAVAGRVRALGARDRARGLKAYDAAKAAGLMP